MYNYVTEGLEMFLDAKWNLGKNNYNSTTVNWHDLSGNENNGFITAPIWDKKKLKFNGSTTWVNCGLKDYYNVTMEALVEFNTIGGASEELNSVCGNQQAGGYGILQKNQKNCACFYINKTWQYVYGSQCKIGEKIHLVATYDGAKIKLYENGILKGEVEASGSLSFSSNHTVFSLGSNPNGTAIGTAPLNGSIYFVRLYNRALTDEEVFQNYKYSIPDIKYLIRADNKIYTIVDNSLSQVTESEITSDLFKNYGTDNIINNLLLTLTNPEILCWVDSEDNVPDLQVKIEAIPKPQIISSEKINLDNPSIKGIEYVTVNCEGDFYIAVSFDNKQTWKMYNGVSWVTIDDDNKFTGMSKQTVEAITLEQWNELYTNASSFCIRVVLLNASQSVKEIYVKFKNT